MTKEEAINYLERSMAIGNDDDSRHHNEIIEFIIEALKECEDCVSRQAVLDMATTIQTDDYSENEILEVVDIDDIKDLPPVTPTRKKGKWIKEYDNSALDGLYHCSVCGRKLWILKVESVSDYPYCHCGAEMER